MAGDAVALRLKTLRLLSDWGPPELVWVQGFLAIEAEDAQGATWTIRLQGTREIGDV
jgi:hypothetical protein